jgi:hypothetical protein
MDKMLTINFETMKNIMKSCISLGQAKPEMDINLLTKKAYNIFLHNVKEV